MHPDRDDLKVRGIGAFRPLVPRKRSDGSPAFICPQPILAEGVVRYVGDPVAFIVAETLKQAKDAAELIAIDYEILPAVVDVEAALAPGAPAVWANNPDNEAFHQVSGSKAGGRRGVCPRGPCRQSPHGQQPHHR